MQERMSATVTRLREEAVKKAREEGVTEQEKLDWAAYDAERQFYYKVSRESEQRFRNFSKSHPEIKQIRDSSHEEDVVKGIDDWIEFEDSAHLPDLPVQIKSSFRGVFEFKKDRKFRERKDLIIVLNCGPRITQEGYDAQLASELARVREILAGRNVHFV